MFAIFVTTKAAISPGGTKIKLYKGRTNKMTIQATKKRNDESDMKIHVKNGTLEEPCENFSIFLNTKYRSKTIPMQASMIEKAEKAPQATINRSTSGDQYSVNPAG